MSRTYKDRPYKVRREDAKREFIYEVHDHSKLGRESLFSFRGVLLEYPTECTINEKKDSSYRNDDGILTKKIDTCHKEMLFSYPNYRKPRSKDINIYYWKPMRTSENIHHKQAVKAYNSLGEVDEDYFLQENTHHALFGGGWWD